MTSAVRGFAIPGWAIIASAWVLPVQAQDFDRVVPKLPPPNIPPAVPVPPAPAMTEGDDSVVIPQLRGVQFLPGPQAPTATVDDSAIGDVQAPDLPLLQSAEFKAQVQAYLNRPLTRADMNAIGALARDLYIASGRPFIDVSLPPQNVQSGVLRFLVTEYRVGDIVVSGNRHFSTELIRDMGDLETGEPLTLPRLRKVVNDYNQNPFLTVNAVTRPGRATGFTDVVLEAQDRTPFRAYAGYDNQGTRLLGRDEWYVGGNWANVLGTGQILSYQYTRSFTGRYQSHSMSYVAPMTPDDRFLLFGAYAIQKPDLRPFFTSKGHAGQISGRWAHDLPALENSKHSLQIGMDYKRTDNNLDFLGLRVLDSSIEVLQFPLIYEGTFNDGSGSTVVEAMLVYSPGDLTDANSDAAFNLFVPFSNATYGYGRISVTRTTFVTQGISWIVRGMFQGATSNLPNSEQLGGGGIGSARGYDPNTALGSEGLLLGTELRSPAFSLLGKDVDDRMQVGVFFDYANLWQRRPYPDLPHRNELASVGFNVNYNVRRYLELQLQVGRQLMKAPFADDRETRAAVIATVGF